MSKQVTCIRKRGGHYNPHERIEAIGGAGWRDPEAVAIANIKRDPKSYYVATRTSSVWVVIGVHNGREYLKTQPDGYEPNNLLALPECPY